MFSLPRNRTASRRAVTLTELLIAVAVMAMMAAALSTLATSVEIIGANGRGRNEAIQHARVTLERIQRNCREATCNATYPGFFAVPEVVGTESFPVSLVVWHPATAAANPGGAPLMSELIVYTTDGSDPSKLLELSDPADTRTSPLWTNLTTWRTEIASLRSRATAKRVVLTSLLRTALASTSTNGSAQRLGAVRFDCLVRPSATEWSEFQAGTRSWQDISWALDIYGKSTGMRQSWCQIELQLIPGSKMETNDSTGQSAIPFFGSAARYYMLSR